jgi:hypothetical protein
MDADSPQNPHPFVPRRLAVGDFQLADRYPQQLGQDGQHGLVRFAILRRGAELVASGLVGPNELFDD